MIPTPQELIKEAVRIKVLGKAERRVGRTTSMKEAKARREKHNRLLSAYTDKQKGSGSGLALAGLAGGAALTGLYLLHKKKKENEAALQAQRAAAQRAAMAGQMKMAEHTGPTSLIKMAAENLSQLRDA